MGLHKHWVKVGIIRVVEVRQSAVCVLRLRVEDHLRGIADFNLLGLGEVGPDEGVIHHAARVAVSAFQASSYTTHPCVVDAGVQHTAKCRTCEGVNDIELRKTKQALLRASKEKEAQLHELDDFDPTTLLDFTCPISFDDPKILQAKQKLVDISRRARHKEYGDIEQLIDAIPTAELPGLWAAANSSFLTY